MRGDWTDRKPVDCADSPSITMQARPWEVKSGHLAPEEALPRTPSDRPIQARQPGAPLQAARPPPYPRTPTRRGAPAGMQPPDYEQVLLRPARCRHVDCRHEASALGAPGRAQCML